jgi:hypothetical protein
VVSCCAAIAMLFSCVHFNKLSFNLKLQLAYHDYFFLGKHNEKYGQLASNWRKMFLHFHSIMLALHCSGPSVNNASFVLIIYRIPCNLAVNVVGGAQDLAS